MKLKIIQNIEDFQLLEKYWNNLYSKGEYSVFQSFEYCYNSVLKLKNIFVIIITDGGEIHEIWPCILKNNNLEFINQKHADFCDILTDKTSNEILNYILNNKEVKSISFKNIKSTSNVHELLSNSPYSHISNEINYSVLKLLKTDSFPANFTHFVYRQRRRLKRILKKYDGEIFIHENTNSVFPKEEILSLRKYMIENGMRSNTFLDDEMIHLIEILYSSNLLQISILKIKSDISAISILFQKEKEYSFWIDLFDNKQMINLYHNTIFIKEITKKSDAYFNFGRGDYSYKIQNFAPDISPLFNVNVFNNKFQLINFKVRYNLLTFVKWLYRKIK